MKTKTLKQRRVKQLNRIKTGAGESTRNFPVKLEHILVPTDFSENSLHALKLAENLAKATDAQLTLLHVIEPVPILPVPESFTPLAVEQPRVIKIAQKKLEALPAAYGIDPRLIGRTVVRVGIPWNEITVTAKELNRDLIVIATHGLTGWKHVLMGSTAERVVRHATCPVLVVR
jgi:universal stress protein A